MASRSDQVEIQRIRRTPQGGLRVDAYPTREGVFTYRQRDGSERRELRLPEEVYAADSLASLRSAPVTDGHPAEPVNPENWKTLSIGHMAEDVRPERPFVSASALVQDAGAISKIEREELREMSCGYECELDETPGIWQGQHYDAIQREIRYNHVALGPKGWGRAGPSVALRLDEKDTPMTEPITPKPAETPAVPAPVMVRIDEKDYVKGSDEHIAVLALRADNAEKALKDAMDPKALSARVQARADLLANARTICGERLDEKEAAGMGDLDLMCGMLCIMDPEFSAEGQSEDFIRGAYTVALKHLAASLEGVGGAEEVLEGDAMGEEEETAEDAGGSVEGEGMSPGSAPPAQPQARAMGGRSDSVYDARRGTPSRQPADKDARRFDSQAAQAEAIKANAEAWKTPLQAHR